MSIRFDESVISCIHVLNGSAKYEYVEGNKDKNVEESFACSKCMDKLEAYNDGLISNEEALKDCRVVCRDCFVDSRVSK